MCNGTQRLPLLEDTIVAENENTTVIENLSDRIAEMEVRLERARAREAEMSRRLEEMKKFVNVMDILETYLRRRYKEQQDHLVQLYSSPPYALVTSK
ncbi:hypothetical protein CASFOL_023437 [Castilleja foliolosa]|uniref:Protein SKIP34 n=1 Tax=Castilleja foliolosa TaxID=1961234 RepID=A0ABD3CLF2_9LAMI